ncbi:MAG: NAD(P)H dehydrogenase [Desulfosporosinus sp. BRH_c37]|nr:MAG: NAD(P)H dehydrogenase [Desulfosporosinus sp. BRH_c37]
MKISVILGHPQKGSFNHAIADKVVQTLLGNGYEVAFHDLYDENFNPILPWGEISKGVIPDPIVQAHCQEIAEAEGIIIIHPNWWGQPPAILKGWVDRVIRAGVAYRFVEDDKGEGVPIGLLKAKATLVFNTSNTPKEREQNVFGDPLEILWKSCIFDLCGVRNFYRKMYGVVVTSSLEQREDWLEDVKEVVNTYFPG